VNSVEVRAELEDLLTRDLLGPWDGPDEELLPGSSPAERYVLGRLVPRAPHRPPTADTAPTDRDQAGIEDEPALVEREVSLTEEANDTEVEPEATVRAGTMAASSLGLAFTVPADLDAISVAASWGRYERRPSGVHETEQGRPRTVWRRAPAGGTVKISLDTEHDDETPPDPAQEGVQLRWKVRRRANLRVVDLAIINGQSLPAETPDVARLYQVQLTVTAVDGFSPIFVGHNDPVLNPPTAMTDDEQQHLALLHRHSREYAHGRQCGVGWEVREGDTRAWRLTTTGFPAADVPLIVPGRPDTMPGVVLDMGRLGSHELARDELVRALRPLVAGYRAWLDTQQQRIESDAEISAYEPAGSQALEDARSLSDRLKRAIDLLRDDPLAREAFRFANQAMALQRVRSELVRARLADPEADLDRLMRELDVPELRSWRPFQLAFVLLCLPGLANPTHLDAHRSVDDAQLQLLFFPTGGGKTEAYLGLTAFTLAIRRLQGIVGDGDGARDGSDGVAVLMRYTLRLLTAQQFQRAAALLCACEHLRRERLAAGDQRWGRQPFRIGLWVGSKVTPNTYEEARRQIDDAPGSRSGPGGPLQLVACPWCGSRLSSRDLTTSDVRRRVLLHCSDPEGACEFTPRRSPDEGLPVLTVDEEIYRLTPALVIGTVDKFAQLPWKGATAPLFGLVERRCPRHGWQNPEFETFCRTRHRAAAGLPGVEPEPTMRLRPPDLIIQDELHLISDALGSMVGLYETAIDHLCTRHNGDHAIRPVVVASTATVRRARDQVTQVFARDLAVFPPQVLDAGETYFSSKTTPSDAFPARRYRGICAPGERLKSIEIRIATAVMEHAQALFDRHGAAAEPYMTLVDYFTSTRELAGMRRLVDDDIADRLSSEQVRTRRRRPQIAELTSRMPSDKIAATLADLERPFDPGHDSSAALDALRRGERTIDGTRAMPLDVLLATSMLQVGVDVQRLGLMLVTGQPKNTAEYIQATSRVGRDRRRPGLVLTLYQWSRPRDLAHYEHFAYDHATFGLRVEGLTTTPFSDRALDRGLTGLMVTAIRHASPSALPNDAAHDVPLDASAMATLLDTVQRRAELVTGNAAVGMTAREELQGRLDRWQHRRATLATGQLGYQDAPDIDGLLREPSDGAWDVWSAPRSLREVEAEVILQLDRRDTSLSDAPPWTYAVDAEGPASPGTGPA
jgi:hypothetical protein